MDIDYGISQTMSMLWPMEFVGQFDRTHDGSGSYGLAAHAPTYKLGQKQERVGLALPLSLCPAFERMNCQTAFQILKSNGQSYDLWANVGAILIHLDVYSELFAALMIATTRQDCIRRSVMLLQTLLSRGEPTKLESKELMVREILAAMKTLERRAGRR